MEDSKEYYYGNETVLTGDRSVSLFLLDDGYGLMFKNKGKVKKIKLSNEAMDALVELYEMPMKKIEKLSLTNVKEYVWELLKSNKVSDGPVTVGK